MKSLSEPIESTSMGYSESLELLNDLASVLNQEAVECFAAQNCTDESALVKVLESKSLKSEVVEEALKEQHFIIETIVSGLSANDLSYALAFNFSDYGKNLLTEFKYYESKGIL